MTAPTLHEVFEVHAAGKPDTYIVMCDITDLQGERYVCEYASLPGDDFGLAPVIRAWLADNPGFPVVPYVAPTSPTVSDYEEAIQAHVDEAARSKLFRDGVTLASYTTSTNPQWASEAQAFVAWRDAVWAYAYQELARVQGGERTQPSIAEIVAELPLISWP